jgi:hypothetical protein
LLVADFDKETLELDKWHWEPKTDDDDAAAISSALNSVETSMPKTVARIRSITSALSSFDWRMSSSVSPLDPQYATQASYRGSSGYREIRRKILTHMRTAAPTLTGLVEIVMDSLNFEISEEE